jgi:hypothetical protein
MFAGILAWLQALPVAVAIREGDALFPWIESLHVLALTLVIGSVAIVDLRLLGLASRDRSVAETTALALPITWSAFLVAVITGGLLFASNASVYAGNRYFQAKAVLILLAGLNMGFYHLLSHGRVAGWHTPALTPRSARVAGGLSLILWISIAACGRWIGFTINAAT